MLEVLIFMQDKKRKQKNKDIIESMINVWAINSDQNPIDVLGSYRGTPYSSRNELPEQDADDL